jgi:peptidoglycan/xylan/chitin deacetylase (PgdA/CDA1 family)
MVPNFSNHPILLTFDLDRDYPIERIGLFEAKSGIKSNTNELKIDAALKGTKVVLDLLDEFNIKATFFIEGVVIEEIQKIDKIICDRLKKHDIGSHSYAHEDLTGVKSKYIPSKFEKEYVVKKSVEVLTTIFNSSPIGFRAPYLHLPDNFEPILSKLGFIYDSSQTIKQATSLEVKLIQNKFYSIPLSTGKDINNKPISGYLWQLHEGNRSVEEYLQFIDSQAKNDNIKYSLLATHPWHLFVNTLRRNYVDYQTAENNITQLRKLLSIISPNTMSITDYLTDLGLINK